MQSKLMAPNHDTSGQFNPENMVRFFLGRTSPMEAQAFAAFDAGIFAENGEEVTAWSMAGSIQGPYARHAQTLPLEAAYQPLGVKPAAPRANIPEVLRAKITEPCYWMPGEPYLYHIGLTLTSPTGEELRIKNSWGIRPLGTGDGQVFWGGKPFFLNMVPLDDWDRVSRLSRQELTQNVYVTSEIDSSMVEAASQLGVALVIDLRSHFDISSVESDAHEQLWIAKFHQIIRLAQKPCVVGYLLDKEFRRLFPGQCLLFIDWKDAVDTHNVSIFQPLYGQENPRNLCLLVNENEQAEFLKAVSSPDVAWSRCPIVLVDSPDRAHEPDIEVGKQYTAASLVASSGLKLSGRMASR